MSRPRISVLTIAKNEERDLPGFFACFSWADEIVIVDDGSTDATREVARAAGARVVSSPRAAGEGFADQRNKGIDIASGDWLVHVDVDMRATPAFAAEARAIASADTYDIVNFPLAHHILHQPVRSAGLGAGLNPPWLVRRGVARFAGVVHEQLRWSPSARVGQMREPMWHLGDADFEERLQKNLLYSRLENSREAALGLRRIVLNAVSASVKTYGLQGGFRDGRVGAFWSIYIAAGTLNRGLLGYARKHDHSRPDLEQRLADQWQALRNQEHAR